MPLLDFIDPGNSGGSVPSPPSPWDGLPLPKPVVYRCVVCDASFPDADRLFQHRFAKHPFRRPALILAGRELSSPREVVAQLLNADHITLANVDRCAFDGSVVQCEKLPQILARQRAGLHSIVLEKFGIETCYEIDFEIADLAELASVERHFLSIVGAHTLSLDRIDLFADMTKQYKTAIRYVDGLSNYLYGVLAKDQRGGTHLPQPIYKTKFNLALNSLKLFNRPLADVVVGAVNFSQNTFTEGDNLAPSPKLQSGMRVFYGFVSGISPKAGKPSSSGGIGNFPVDHATDQLILWTLEGTDELLLHRRQMEAVVASTEWVPNDRLKVTLLLAERLASDGQLAAAKTFARNVLNDANFGDWAQRIMDLKVEK